MAELGFVIIELVSDKQDWYDRLWRTLDLRTSSRYQTKTRHQWYETVITRHNWNHTARLRREGRVPGVRNLMPPLTLLL